MHKNNITYLSQALDTANLNYTSLAELATLFRAIVALSAEDSLTHGLAVMGTSLAEDLANDVDVEREGLQGLKAQA